MLACKIQIPTVRLISAEAVFRAVAESSRVIFFLGRNCIWHGHFLGHFKQKCFMETLHMVPRDAIFSVQPI